MTPGRLSKRSILVLAIAVFAVHPLAGRADDVDDMIAYLKPSPSDDAAWAAKLVKAAQGLEANRGAQVRLCGKAYECGLKSPAGHASALAAVDLLETLAPERTATWRQKRLEVYHQQYLRSARTDKVASGTAYIKLLVAEAERCGQDKNWRDATKCYRQAYQVALTLRLPERNAIYENMRVALNREMVQNRIKVLHAALDKDPKNAPSRKQLVMTYLVDLDRPDEAAKYLDETVDAALRKQVSMAAKEASALADADFLTLAQWYHALSTRAALKHTKVRMLTRALQHVNRYLEVHTTKDFLRLRATSLAAKTKAALEKYQAPPPAKSPALPTGAVLFLTFEKSTLVTRSGRTTVRDTSGAGHDGLVVGGAVTSRAGGQAIVLDGASYVNLGNPPKLQITGRITLSAWIKPRAVDGMRNIVAHGFCRTPPGEVQLRIVDGRYETGSWTGGTDRAARKGHKSTGHNVAYAMPAGDVGTWVHLAGTYDGRMWRLYRNGKEVASSAERVGAVPVKANWAIGAAADGGERHFDGAIDDVMIFSRALSAEEIRRLCGPR